MTKAALFDLGNTLVGSLGPGEIIQAVMREKGIGLALEDIERAHDEVEAKLARGESFRRLEGGSDAFYIGWNSAILYRLGIEDDNGTLGKFILERWFDYAELSVFPDARDILAELGRRRIKTGVITNGFRSEAETVFARVGLKADDFGVVVGCDTAGAGKPDPAPFLHAAKALGVSPSDCVFAGDSYAKDYVGARDAGMRPVLVVRNGEPHDESVTFVRRLTELSGML